MRAIIHLLKNGLASFAIQLFFFRLHHKGPQGLASETPVELSLTEEVQKIKKMRRRHKPGPPPFMPLVKKKYRSKLHYQSTKSKNVRDLDQRKIRRKFINS